MKPTVYIETTIISYLTSRPSRNLIVAGHQQLTQDWWRKIRPQVACFISPFVLQEISRGDQHALRKRMEAIAHVPILTLTPAIPTLAQQYFDALILPDKARLDAAHLAVATWYKMDYVLSWNCKHIVGGRVRKTLMEVNSRLCFETPILCTPEELMEV